MEPPSKMMVSLEDPRARDINLVGSKTKNLSLLINENFKVPEGFCISTDAYRNFIFENKLYNKIDMEISRKSMEDMRWEEIWDASLRIRSAFLKAEIPPALRDEISKKIERYPKNVKFSVRSSSPSEDSEKTSFAGIHESYINVNGLKKILESIKLVWASLWSDRAILYREELNLDSFNSSIAVLIQKMEKQPVSGLAFSREPTGINKDHMVIEAVEGLLANLVDNIKEGEKWVIDRNTREILQYKKSSESKNPILDSEEIELVADKILKIENIFGYPVDVEWTGTGHNFTLLQSRPITSLDDSDKDRKWYLTLTPNFNNLKKLADKVENKLIPELVQTANNLALDSPEKMNRTELAKGLKERALTYSKWKKIYWDDFIPFAHGIRNLGTYYNDLLKPENPYEFMELLRNTELIASQRDEEIKKLSQVLNKNPSLKSEIKILISSKSDKELIKELEAIKSRNLLYNDFVSSFFNLLNKYMDVAYENQSFSNHPQLVLNSIYQLSKHPKTVKSAKSPKKIERNLLLSNLYAAAGDSRRSEVDEILRIARLSWKLRDDDNILLGRVESQLLKYLKTGSKILIKEKRLDPGVELTPQDWEKIYQGLIDNKTTKISIPPGESDKIKESSKNYKARQLIGQPSSPGIATGQARIINSFQDFSKLKSGEILVCDAIQPQMTFLVSIAAGIVERRGGMLVHSSIIAREMGIPAVNGVSKATQQIKNGDMLTVNGYLGLVVIGEPEFNLEYGITAENDY
ncbi:MAG: PEP/pyruvate-binding domain-containing protein [Methanomicrobiales archaeon]